MIALILVAGPLVAQPIHFTRAPNVTVAPPAELPKPVEVSAELGRPIRLVAEVAVRWECCDLHHAQLISASDGKACAFVAAKSGRYLVLATAAEGPAARILITVSDGATPPTPQPDPPAPVDPLVARLRQAFDKDLLQIDTRRKAAAELQAVYSVAATVIGDPEITSVAQHSARVKAVLDQRFSAIGLPADSLSCLRKVVAEELQSAFPDGPPTTLTADTRLHAGALYSRVASAVGVVIATQGRTE